MVYEHHLSIDIETKSGADISSCGAYKYAMDEEFEILLIAYKMDDEETRLIEIQKEMAYLTLMDQHSIEWYQFEKHLQDPTVLKHAYNASFEYWCLNRAGFRTPIDQWQCTMVHAAYCGYPMGLEATGKAMGIRAEKQKLAYGKALIRLFCTPQKPTKKNGGRRWTRPKDEPEKWQEFKAYCVRDVDAEHEIATWLDHFPMPDAEWELWRQDVLMNAQGARVDRKLIEGALYIDSISTQELEDEARQITKLDNPNSTTQLLNWLYARKSGLPNLQKATVAEALECDLDDDVRRILEIRQQLGKTSNKKYQAAADAICADDRVRGLIQFYAANRTGRYGGRLVQVQNLTKHHIGTLDEARELVKAGNVDAIKMLYGNVQGLLSQLIRTMFLPSEGRKLIVADFSAIEARVIAWLAREEWVNEVFKTHGKIYEATAAQMFHCPIETIVRGHENYGLRQKGKVATLALGYQGGTNALITMGALNMGLVADELQDIVDRWRNANKMITSLWYETEYAALDVVQTGIPKRIAKDRIEIALEEDGWQRFMTVRLPSGRKLFYCLPTLDENRFGKLAVHYYEVNGTTKKWERTSTYGGKLVENCIAEGSYVVTPNGPKAIETITDDDLIWDGEEWVSHEGLIDKGVQDVICVDGVEMTADHRILTEEGWKDASQSERYNRYAFSLPDSYSVRRIGRKEVIVESTLRLREGVRHACDRVHEREDAFLRMHGENTPVGEKPDARYVEHKDMGGVAFDEREVSHSDSTSVEELRRQGHHGMREVETQFRELPCGYGADVLGGCGSGQAGQQPGLLSGELPLGEAEGQCEEQKDQRVYQHSARENDHIRGFGEVRSGRDNDLLQDEERVAGRFVVDKTRLQKRVYDIRNCGPRNRFAVYSIDGVMIVHNCVQAIARDCLTETIRRVEEKGWDILFHVHDEVVIDAPMDVTVDEVCDLMSEPIPWAKGLVLKAAGFESEYYMKD